MICYFLNFASTGITNFTKLDYTQVLQYLKQNKLIKPILSFYISVLIQIFTRIFYFSPFKLVKNIFVNSWKYTNNSIQNALKKLRQNKKKNT